LDPQHWRVATKSRQIKGQATSAGMLAIASMSAAELTPATKMSQATWSLLLLKFLLR